MAYLQSYSVLGESVAIANGFADVVVSNHIVSIPTVPQFDYRRVLSSGGGWLANQAETRGQYTLTPTGSFAAGAKYSFLLQQVRPDLGNTVVQEYVSYTSQSTGDTATSIVTALASAITATTNFKVTVTTGSTLVIQANAGYPLITVTQMSPIASLLTITQNTAGVPSRGTYNDLLRAGVAAADITSGHTYYTLQLTFPEISAGDWIENTTIRQHTLYVYSSATNFAGFSAGIQNLISVPGTAANIKGLNFAV